jgi:hypothetical protein
LEKSEDAIQQNLGQITAKTSGSASWMRTFTAARFKVGLARRIQLPVMPSPPSAVLAVRDTANSIGSFPAQILAVVFCWTVARGWQIPVTL